MLLRPPRRTIEYDCGVLCRKPCQAGAFTASLRKPVRNPRWYSRLSESGSLFCFFFLDSQVLFDFTGQFFPQERGKLFNRRLADPGDAAEILEEPLFPFWANARYIIQF